MSGQVPAKHSFRSHFRNVSSLAGVIGPLVLALTTIIAHFHKVPYDWLSQTISQLGVGPYGWVENTGFIVMGVLSITFAEALYAGFRPRRSLTAAVVVWILIGFTFIAAGIFVADPVAVGITTLHGVIHDVAGHALAVFFPFACFLMLPGFEADIHWDKFVVYTIVAGAAAFVLDSLRILVPWHLILPWNGVYERIILVNALVWLELVALKLLSHTRDSDKPPDSAVEVPQEPV